MGAYFRRKGVMAGIIFIVLVIASGSALQASGNMRNPFSALLGRGGFEGGREGFEGGRPGEGAPPAGGQATGSEQRPQRPEGGGGGRGGRGGEGFEGGNGLQWSQLGPVLFDIWFLFAFSAVIMVISQIIKGVKNVFKRGNNSPPTDLTVAEPT